MLLGVSIATISTTSTVTRWCADVVLVVSSIRLASVSGSDVVVIPIRLPLELTEAKREINLLVVY